MHMIDLLHGTQTRKDQATAIRLDKGFRSDLAWWRALVEAWNGIGFVLQDGETAASLR